MWFSLKKQTKRASCVTEGGKKVTVIAKQIMIEA